MTNTHHQYCIDVCNSFSHKTCTVAIIPTVILPCDLHILRIIVYLLTATVDTQKSDFRRSITDVDVEISAGSNNSKSVHIQYLHIYLCAHGYCILYFAWEDQSDSMYRIVHTRLISCITVLYESYSTVMHLIGQIQYTWANTVQL